MRRGDDLGPEEERDPELEGTRSRPLRPARGSRRDRCIIALLAILLIAFAIANFERVDVNFLLFESRARLVTVIAVAAGARAS